VAREVFLAV
jgi:hypothetical protein